MASETFVLSVLPVTRKDDAASHVSLHISPRLSGDTTLGAFDLFREWAGHAAKLDWGLVDGAGQPIAATALTDAIQPDLWPRIFPPETPVDPPRFDTMANRDWRSFPVRAAHDLAVATALYGTLLFPIDTPVFPPRRRGEDRLDGLMKMLDDEVGATKTLEAIATNPKLASQQPLVRALATLQQVRRFYERPEAQREYEERPTQGLAHLQLPLPEPDFHTRVAHLTDQPALLRLLGLVIDLKVADPAVLAKAKELRATVNLPDAQVLRARTPIIVSGDRLLTRPRTKDWRDGKLLLGGDDYEVLALDTDGSALKLERYVRSLPRMRAVQENGDAGNAAPPAQRSEGFTIVRTGRLAQIRGQLKAAGGMIDDAAAGTPPVLATEDVTRGYRVEIWDDHERTWFSPHRRLATATLTDGTVVYTDRPESGAVQTAAASETPGSDNGSVYLHEALFGWSGWSLSAPRPGPRAVPEGGKEKVEEATPPEKPVIPVQVTTRVMPGTLPRLRYGRSYAFRAWSVDLAGNSPGDPVTTGNANARVVTLRHAIQREAAATGLRAARPIANHMPEIARAAHRIAERLGKSDLHAAVGGLATLDATAPVTPRLTGIAERDREIVRTLRTRAAAKRVGAPASAGVASLLRDALPGVSLEQSLGQGVPITPDTTQSPLVPFRRWDPVPPPVVVARHRFSMAESIRHLVIRSGVDTADPAGAAPPAITPPAAYLEQVAAADAKAAQDWRAISERHLAAPKGSQHLNELHGRFDDALDDPARAVILLATALREDGTFFDDTIVDLTDPTKTIPQPGVSLQANPEVTNPMTDLGQVTGDDHRGDPLPPNHYVIHDTDQLALPYLPDPMAAGVALDMIGANRDSPLMFAYRVESTAVRFTGDWPAPEPIRLILESAPVATARMAGNVLTIGLPPGGRLDLGLSSSLRRTDLPLFALWNLLPASLRALDLIERPAADGQFWALTPAERISLVHAVPRPVLPPLLNWLVPIRGAAVTHVDLIGAADAHAASTDRIDIEASWWEWRDDPAAPGPIREEHHAAAAHATIAPGEDLVIWGGNIPDGHTIDVMEVGRVPVHRTRHELGDTRHRTIDYRLRATTRFREYFPESLMQRLEDRSQVSAPRSVSITSTARPPAPRIHSVLPLFRWDEESDPGQPFGLRRRRRSGVRLYLERPWYQSGDGEKLAVIFGSKAYGDPAQTSVWGSDPLWVNQGPPDQFVGLALEDAYTAIDLDPVRGHDARVGPPASARLVDVPGTPSISLLAYVPEYNKERRLWYVDVALEPGAAIWPFVRLAVARYQPDALPGMTLSPIVLADFCQLPPERTMTVSRPDADSVRVSVSGPIGLRSSFLDAPNQFGTVAGIGGPRTAPSPDLSANYPLGKADITNVVARDRRMFAVLEHRPESEESDLGWRAVKRKELSIGGVSPAREWAWTGVIDLPEPLDLTAPGGATEWRVTVEEHEGLDADPVDPNTAAPLTKAWRMIYADRTAL